MEGMSQLGCIDFPCIQCRQDNSLLWDLPTESSFMGQIISSGLHHFRLFFLHTKLSKDISGTGNLDPSLIVDVFLNQDYSGDSNGGICVIIPALGDENRDLPCFCLPTLPRKSPWGLGSYYTPLERYS